MVARQKSGFCQNKVTLGEFLRRIVTLRPDLSTQGPSGPSALFWAALPAVQISRSSKALLLPALTCVALPWLL